MMRAGTSKSSGTGLTQGLAESTRKVMHWTNASWEKSGAAFAKICPDLVAFMNRPLAADSHEVQDVIRQSDAGHGQLIVDSDLRQGHQAYHPQLPEFTAAAIKVFAATELS